MTTIQEKNSTVNEEVNMSSLLAGLMKVADDELAVAQSSGEPMNDVTQPKGKEVKEHTKTKEESGEQPPQPQQPQQPAPVQQPVDPNAVIEFLVQNPNLNDGQVQQFAEQGGYDAGQVRSMLYALATKFVSFLKGGRTNERQLDIATVSPQQLEQGISVEMEHTPDPAVAKKIVLDHLSEIPDYYTRLAKMETEAQGTAAQPAPTDDEYEEETAPESVKQSAYMVGVKGEIEKLANCGAMHRVKKVRKRAAGQVIRTGT